MNAINRAVLNDFTQDQMMPEVLDQGSAYTIRAQTLAERSTIRTLLNCYIREVARPRQQITERPPAKVIQTLPLGWRQQHRSACWLLINLSHSQQQVMVAVSRATLLGNYRYAYPVLTRAVKGSGAAWREVNANQLAQLLVVDLCDAEGVPYNREFLLQIQHSQRNTADIIRQQLQEKDKAEKSVTDLMPDDLYLYSEQSLPYGHAFHPTPKSRQWSIEQSEADYAPEYRCHFQLHWFRIKSELLRIETVLPLTASQLMADIFPTELPDQEGTTLVPVHPVQARYLLDLPVTQQAITDGLIENIGPAGMEFAPTASVRTLYNSASPWFLKGSLNIRITNCVRKNAVYELESALAIHRRLQKIKPALQACHSGFRLLGEPGFLTLQLPELSAEDDKVIQEGFGMVVRQNITEVLKDNEQAVLAGALFQQGDPLDAFVTIKDKVVWLERYAEAIIPPVLEAFFQHGLIFEPHLQNTVICLDQSQPTGVILRDFEGVKLVDQLWPEDTLTDLSERARQSVHYSFDQGWNRVRYCLFINNLSEAVSYLADDQTELERQLWQVVKGVIQSYLSQSKNPDAQDRLTKLLAGEAIPSKTNLLVRINKNPDRAAGYVPVASPFNSTPFNASYNSGSSSALLIPTKRSEVAL